MNKLVTNFLQAVSVSTDVEQIVASYNERDRVFLSINMQYLASQLLNGVPLTDGGYGANDPMRSHFNN